MRHHRTFMAISKFGLALFLLLSERTLDQCKADAPPETRSDPVLKAGDDAKTVVSKAIKAHGGAKAFARWSCGYLTYKTKGGVVPALLGEVTLEETFQLPGHFKRVTRTTVAGRELTIIFVLNHGKGWSKRGDAPAEPIESTYTDQTQHPFGGFCNLSPLTEAEVNLTKLGPEKVNGKDAIGIRAHSDKFGERDFYFALQSGLLLKAKMTLPGPDRGKPTVMEPTLDDYKDVQGIPVPMRIKGTHDGKPVVDVTLIEVRFADKFDESTFAKP